MRAAGHDPGVVGEGKPGQQCVALPVGRPQVIVRAAPKAEVRGAERDGVPAGGRPRRFGDEALAVLAEDGDHWKAGGQFRRSGIPEQGAGVDHDGAEECG